MSAKPSILGVDDPTPIRLLLQRAPLATEGSGSLLASPLVCPMLLRGSLVGFLGIGERRQESFDPSEIAALAHVAESAGNALGLLDRDVAHHASSGGSTPANAVPTNLPHQANALVGREAELAQVLLDLQRARLVTLVGMGGLGKTRLSIEAAMRALPRFPDGAWFVDFSPIDNGSAVPDVVASTLGIKQEASASTTDSIARSVGEQRVLLVLDNCEHVVRACAGMVSTLLQACPGLHVVATSREGMRIAGEVVFAMEPLALPPDGARIDAAAAGGHDAIRLFVARATASMPTFALTDANAAAVVSICRRLDGIALAIELAACWVRALPVEAIAQRLDDRFRLLTTGDRVAPTRQQALAASIDWSYDLLTEDERAFFRPMAIFAGGWTLDSAESIAAACGVSRENVLDLQARLIDKSLVRMVADTARYRMLDTVRDYGLRKLEGSDEARVARDAHLRFFLNLAEEAAPKLVGHDEAAWMARLDAEQDNLLAAHAWCDHAPDGALQGLRLALATRMYWLNRGLMSAGLRMAEAALAREGAHGDTLERCRLLVIAGQMDFFMGRYDAALPPLREGLELAQRLDEPERASIALRNLGMVTMARGDLAQARDLIEQGVAMARKSGNRREIASALNGLAQLHFAERRFADAKALDEEFLAISRELGEHEFVVVALCNLAMATLELQAPQATRHHLAEALGVGTRVGSKPAVQYVVGIGAALAVELGELEQAARLSGAFRGMVHKTGIRPDPADEAFMAPRLDRLRQALAPAGLASEESVGAAWTNEQATAQLQRWLGSFS